MKVVQLLVFVSAIFVSETRAADSIEVPLVPSGDVLTTTETISTNAPIFFPETNQNFTRCYKYSGVIVASDPPLKMSANFRSGSCLHPPLKRALLGAGDAMNRLQKWWHL